MQHMAIFEVETEDNGNSRCRKNQETGSCNLRRKAMK